MAYFHTRSTRFVTVVLIVSIALSGCSGPTLESVREIRNMPMGPAIESNYRFYYDPAIRAYRQRLNQKDGKEPLGGKALRDGNGKKIQTEEELGRILGGTQKEVTWTKTKTTVYIIVGVIYVPVIVALFTVQGVLNIPFGPVVAHLKTTYERNAEDAYVSGRRHFDSGEFEAALTEWEHAMLVMPSLQAFSDIDYWRGRAFEAKKEFGKAQIAYDTFLSYSESATPLYFKKTYPNDLTWEKKAKDAEMRITALVNNDSRLSMQLLRSSTIKVILP